MDNHIPVLIIGAGPTGLMMACELARNGVGFRIIDKKPARTATSNATWIQARTIELFDKMGLASRFLKAGHTCDAINVYANGEHLFKLSLKHINSAFPLILMLPQSETEKILTEYLHELHGKVERSLELTDIKLENDRAISTVHHADGKTETITSDWVIACDGVNSLVRKTCGISFPGEELTEQFMVADANIDFSFMSKDEVHFFFDVGTVLAAFPLGFQKYRIAANLHLDYPRKLFTEREVIEIVQERAHGKYYVSDVEAISPFWVHSRYASQMRHGAVFLAGDAAHVLSPASGQGMNTGLQDCHNLAWKLALVIKGKAKAELLDTYQAERHAIVKQAVNENEHYSKTALLENDFLMRLKQFSEQEDRDEWMKLNRISERISQLEIRYTDSPVIDYANKVSGAAPLPGDHAPDIALDKSTRLYNTFNHAQHNILLFSGLDTDKDKLEKIKELKQQLDQAYPDLVKTILIAKDNMAGMKDVVIDKNAAIHHAYQVTEPAVFVLRPDTYIAYCSAALNFNAIRQVLATYLSL